MTALSALVAKAIAAAASLTGKKFALMVASSLVATTGVLAAGMTGSSNDLGPLAALLGRNVAASETPVGSEPEAEPETAADTAGGSPQPASDGGASPSGSLPSSAPTEEEETSEEPEEESPPPE